MAYFLEYVTDQTIGRFLIERTSFADALTMAADVLLGLPCTSAVLRQVPVASAAFGEGSALAAYTPVDGWLVHETGLE